MGPFFLIGWFIHLKILQDPQQRPCFNFGPSHSQLATSVSSSGVIILHRRPVSAVFRTFGQFREKAGGLGGQNPNSTDSRPIQPRIVLRAPSHAVSQGASLNPAFPNYGQWGPRPPQVPGSRPPGRESGTGFFFLAGEWRATLRRPNRETEIPTGTPG